MNLEFITGAIKLFEYYKKLGEETFTQLSEPELFWKYNKESNSIAIIINHLAGNMLSRWTNFLTSDGEKTWRNRDEEFEEVLFSRDSLIEKWNKGWDCLLNALKSLKTEDLQKIIYIRNEGHTVEEAVSRQLAHYPYHFGQIVFIGKMLTNEKWKSLSIPKGNSNNYNNAKFSKEKQKSHFTDDFIEQ